MNSIVVTISTESICLCRLVVASAAMNRVSFQSQDRADNNKYLLKVCDLFEFLNGTERTPLLQKTQQCCCLWVVGVYSTCNKHPHTFKSSHKQLVRTLHDPNQCSESLRIIYNYGHFKGLKMIGKGFVLFKINSSPSAFYIIKPTCIS